ncbi:hypothetical protein ACFQ3P_26155 [Paraburkholderia sabiae]|uniref:Uracil-DNA glycosylase n=1 Tax=Paraburkholderia sabiae TaxID=273251 RepID=A0ABU9QL07_9BURK|nr:hypothetical protein [Paraburkholderia sabiae]WJZ77391.1 hypothetical protein QEN71_35580 [Paraburkholderia sabiae]CAD6547460.1 hypothetical protein LMG24235_04425 [Paraburkholderia sabiae]
MEHNLEPVPPEAIDSPVTLALAHRYLEILSQHTLGEIFQEVPALSGLFLAGVPAGIDDAVHRVMVVGMETRAWRDDRCPFKAGELPTIASVQEAMSVQARVLAGGAGRFRFLQFLKQVSRSANRRVSTGKVSVIWGNLFCVSHHGGSPVGATTFGKIQALSMQLLRAQIEVIRPDAILFTTGAGYDSHLRSFFPDRTLSERIAPRRLWKFRLGRTVCYRTSHPRYVAHNCWREHAMAEVFASFNEGTTATEAADAAG